MEAGLFLAQWTGDPNMFSTSANANQRVSAVEAAITMACDLAFKHIAPSHSGKPPAHWWNADIASKRKTCIAAKRAKTRCVTKLHLGLNRGQEEAVAVANSRYKEAKKCLKSIIAARKERFWK